jgi:xanthine dehydrogenase accessory factor
MSEELARLAEASEPCALATVISTWGSAPRQPGAHLLVQADGGFFGSVSGGCVEGAVIDEALHVIRSGKHALLRFGVSNAQAWEVGLACGGEIEILVQPVSDAGFAPSLARQILDANAQGRAVAVQSDLHSGASWTVDADAGKRTGKQEGSFLQLYQPPLRLAIIGAVHISAHLVALAATLGIETCVIDPRSAFLGQPAFAGVARSGDWPDDALKAWQPGAGSAVVALTHDPKIDDPALIEALRSPAFYIAALGSRKSHAARLERLKAQGFDESALTRIHGPAGLAIGARSPAEIAVSVLAQLIATWRQA